jgi:hypothetical protein
MDRAQANNAIVDALVNSIRDRANYGYSITQNVVPVDTGALKAAGSIKDIEKGSEIKYAKEYASIVERGSEDHYEMVSSHVKRGNLVRGYMRHVKAKDGAHFIENSLKQSFEGFSNSIDMFLRVKFPRVERR